MTSGASMRSEAGRKRRTASPRALGLARQDRRRSIRSMTSLLISFNTNADEVARRLDDHARRQLPFAVAQTINRITKGIGDEAKAKLPSQFRFRSDRTRRFFEMFIGTDADQIATKRNLRGAVGIRAPLRGRFDNIWRVGILTKFQYGGDYSPPGGAPNAIPTNYLRSLYPRGIPRSMYPKSLGLLERRSIEGGHVTPGARTREASPGQWKTVLRGARRTFAIDLRFHQASNPTVYGVWQRRGRRRDSEPFLLWAYKPSVRIPKRLTFLEDAERHYQRHFSSTLAELLAMYSRESRARAAADDERPGRGRQRRRRRRGGVGREPA